MPDHCSLCGTLVEIIGTDEGTMHYRPVTTPQEARRQERERIAAEIRERAAGFLRSGFLGLSRQMDYLAESISIMPDREEA